ncbi:MAG: hypothetical protein FWD55_06015 [Propionibacteriaceae bacterium]|nr:hypothetical protein [Propionibacteriaceae bacterium]
MSRCSASAVVALVARVHLDAAAVLGAWVGGWVCCTSDGDGLIGSASVDSWGRWWVLLVFGVLRWVLVGESVAKQCIHFLAVGFVTVRRQNPPQGRGWGQNPPQHHHQQNPPPTAGVCGIQPPVIPPKAGPPAADVGPWV